MYNMYGFGKRISSCRKLLGLTQEELAERLSITAQAVSKWENELSFPEITILPTLARELNTTIEKLFGSDNEAAAAILAQEPYKPYFPERKNETLSLVHTFGGVACYSEKQVEVTNEDSVVFKDGSSANLRQLRVINKGPGEVCFDFADEAASYRNLDMSRTELNKVFEKIDSVEISAVDASYKVIRSEDNRTHVSAKGSPLFLDGLTIESREGTLSVYYKSNNGNNNGLGSNNSVIIAFGRDSGKSLQASINGSGVIEVKIPFEIGNTSINGSGVINLGDADNFGAKINGSGNINCGRAGNLKIKINGSGDVEMKEVFGSFEAKINGSGDVRLGCGQLERLEAKINGSGDIVAGEVETRLADLTVEGSGDITIGRVIEESIEKHSRKSFIRVLKRG